ncbi:Uncharacterised protein [Vibrio cholerae]|uniref:Uncharacterized protein n=1 Tax=Vibrio cholerae TaxID=666 RepID=A0A655QI16_VIBCL|nr:Uncharacterised protein [Vibrio cholerae]
MTTAETPCALSWAMLSGSGVPLVPGQGVSTKLARLSATGNSQVGCVIFYYSLCQTDFTNQFCGARGVTHFVVIPSVDLHHSLTNHHGGERIHNR